MSVSSGRAAPAESKGIRCAEFKKSAPLPLPQKPEPARAAASPAPRSLHTILTGGVEPAPHARGPATRVPCPVRTAAAAAASPGPGAPALAPAFRIAFGVSECGGAPRYSYCSAWCVVHFAHARALTALTSP